uniref:Uncharacterized protein n=1 Tax=Rhizophora mucronata TaxID=61149 RepID=A0A2P2NCC2_RHIMU
MTGNLLISSCDVQNKMVSKVQVFTANKETD